MSDNSRSNVRGGRHGRLVLVIALLALPCLALSFGKEKYDRYKVIRVHPSSNELMSQLESRISKDYKSVLPVHRNKRSSFMDLVLSPEALQDLLELIEFLQIPHETLIDDLGIAIGDHENDVLGLGRSSGGHFDLHRYNTLQQIRTWLVDQAVSYPHMMEIIEIGKSWEGRPIEVVKLTEDVNHSYSKKPAIWMDAGIHSNEWIGPATLLYYINEILTQHRQDPGLADLLQTYDLYVLPVLNVDGYEYSWTEDRLWRKSRSQRNSSECQGVDMNRNWPFKWGYQPGVSTDPCSNIYGGPRAMSEPEVRAVVRFLRAHRRHIKSYVAFHSYSQLWMMPWSYSDRKPKDYDLLVNVSRQVVEAIEETNGKDYAYGSVIDLLGEASGSSVDFTYGQLGVTYSFGVELRDDGLFGSLLPPSQIVPTARETLEGIKKMASLIDLEA